MQHQLTSAILKYSYAIALIQTYAHVGICDRRIGCLITTLWDLFVQARPRLMRTAQS